MRDFDWNNAVDKRFEDTRRNLLETLERLVSKVMTEHTDSTPSRESVIVEQEGGRFSISIPIPKLVPTESWGDPNSQSRKDIERIFASITREPDIRARIRHVNSFLIPSEAVKKAPGGRINAVLNMMQIVEALQACLNDYSESSAGFVFEGFMAALTGGKQISGRIGGTLPIEDFVAFSETGGGAVPTSLKLLSPSTPIHGSFTNLIDYLFIRGGSGEPEIKYLIAYKDKEGDAVSKMSIFDFTITRENVIQMLMDSGKNNVALLGNMARQLKQHTDNWQDSPEWRLKMAQILAKTPGYTKKRGMFFSNLDSEGDFFDEGEKTPEEGATGFANIQKKEAPTRMGKGPTLTTFDRSMIPNQPLKEFVIETAEKNNIPLQLSYDYGGGTDAGRIHLSRAGCPSVVIGIPTRHIHSHVGILSLKDAEDAIKLAIELTKTVDEEKVNSFTAI